MKWLLIYGKKFGEKKMKICWKDRKILGFEDLETAVMEAATEALYGHELNTSRGIQTQDFIILVNQKS